MSSASTPHPLLYVVPARRAVVREPCTYDEAMTSWLGQCKEHVEALERWYQPLRPASAPLSFFEAWRLARSIVTRRWEATLAGPVTTVACVANPGATQCEEFPPPLVRLWKGPLRVLLEQEKYGVLGRTLRTVSTWGGVLDPPFGDPMMEGTGSGATVGEDGVVTITCDGREVALRQNYRGEVTLTSAVFLPGDVLEFPLFTLLNHVQVEGLRGAEFNPLGSPFLGTTVQDGTGSSPGTVRIHDNLLAMRFQLHLNMTRGAFYSTRPVLGGALDPGGAPAENAPAAPPPTDEDIQKWDDAQVIRYGAELPMNQRRSLVRRARPALGQRDVGRFVRLINQFARRLTQYRNQKRRLEQAEARRRELEARQRERELTREEQLVLERSRNIERVTQLALGRLRLDYGALANHAAVCGTTLYARGIVYGGSLQSTPPDAYGDSYRYAAPAWGSMTGLATYRAYGSILEHGESDRLTTAWTCTPSTLATTYFLLHGKNPRVGGSVRSQVDDRVGMFFPFTHRRRGASPIAKLVRFHRYRGYGDAHPDALPRLRDGARGAVQRLLESASLQNHPRLERLRDDLALTVPATVQYPLTLPDLRQYFLGDQNAAYSVVTLSGHEFMLFWLWPHERLLSEAAQAEGEAPAPFDPVGPPPVDPAERDALLSVALGTKREGEPPQQADADFCEYTSGDDSTDLDEDLGEHLDDGEGSAPVSARRLFDAAMASSDATRAARRGPPVAGFIAAYNPLDGTPFDTTTLGDLFGYEASGALMRVRYLEPDHGQRVARSAFTGKPARFQAVEQVWLTEHPAGHDAGSILFDDIGQNRRTQIVMAMTHFDRDALRALYRHPIPLETLTLSERSPVDARVDGYFRVPLPRRRPNEPEPEVPFDRASIVAGWYADRAVPFPTLLETRDDSSYPRRTHVERHTNTVRSEIQRLIADRAALERSETVRRRGTAAHEAELTAFVRFLGG